MSHPTVELTDEIHQSTDLKGDGPVAYLVMSLTDYDEEMEVFVWIDDARNAAISREHEGKRVTVFPLYASHPIDDI